VIWQGITNRQREGCLSEATNLPEEQIRDSPFAIEQQYNIGNDHNSQANHSDVKTFGYWQYSEHASCVA
jgi:hypothetical protein